MSESEAKHTVYLALGANQGRRAANLQAARGALGSNVRLLAMSPVYATPPWGYTNQPEFLNQVVKGETPLSPEELLAFLKSLEEKLGRTPTFRYGPRPIDIDILFYDRLVLDTPALTIPHPRLGERAFVLVPLADLAPDLQHPTLGRTVSQLLANADQSGIRPYTA